jgi:biopolymer transport protein ExbB/TolQ
LFRPEDIIWDVPVVLFCVWTVVLVVASLIVISCLGRETKKFHKRLSKADSKEDPVRDIAKLDYIMARYVQQFLGQGILDKLANSLANNKEESQIETLRFEERDLNLNYNLLYFQG